MYQPIPSEQKTAIRDLLMSSYADKVIIQRDNTITVRRNFFYRGNTGFHDIAAWTNALIAAIEEELGLSFRLADSNERLAKNSSGLSSWTIGLYLPEKVGAVSDEGLEYLISTHAATWPTTESMTGEAVGVTWTKVDGQLVATPDDPEPAVETDPLQKLHDQVLEMFEDYKEARETCETWSKANIVFYSGAITATERVLRAIEKQMGIEAD